MKKNAVFIPVLLLALGMIFSGCTKKQEVNSPASGTSITFWHTYNDTEDAILQNVVLPRWNALHPDIQVKPVRQDSGQFHQMVVTSFGTGQSPDVARVDIVNTAAYANQGGIIPLDSFTGFNGLAGNFLEGPLSTNLYKGKYYGLPLDTNCKAAVLNTHVLGDLGITGTDFTMETFINAARNRGSYSLNVSGFGDWDLYLYFWLFGGVLTDDGFTKASGYLDSAQSVAAINKLIELHNQKIFTIRDLDGSIDAWDGINSEYAMFFEGPWFFGAYGEREAAGIVASTIPTYNGITASVVGGENIAIFSTSKNQDAAYQFVTFMVSEEVQLAMLESGQIPVLKSLVNNPSVTGDPVWSVYMKQLNLGAKARIPSPNQTTISEIWSDAMTNIFVAGSNVQSELTQAARLMDEQLTK
jgi:multiple sugar transport system substrate-binding protein